MSLPHSPPAGGTAAVRPASFAEALAGIAASGTTSPAALREMRSAVAALEKAGPDPANWSGRFATFSGTLTLGGGCHEAEAVHG
jgi:hypothetical protein